MSAGSTNPPHSRLGSCLDIDRDYFSQYHEPDSGGDWLESWMEPPDVVAELHARISHAEVITVTLSLQDGYVSNNLLLWVLPICDGAENLHMVAAHHQLELVGDGLLFHASIQLLHYRYCACVHHASIS